MVCSMTPSQTSELIKAAGGVSAFARLLGLDAESGYQQRVNNWKHRGIPPAVILEHYDTIRGLQAQLPRQKQRRGA